MIKKLLCLYLLMLFGCASLSDLRLSEEFDKVSDAYESAIKWGDFELACSYLSKKNLKKDQALPDKKFLKKIKITSYEVQSLKLLNPKSLVEQTVEIKYYNTDYLIEKTINDNQIWIYESDSWRLSSGLPVFE